MSQPSRTRRPAVVAVTVCAVLAAVLSGCGEDPDAGTNGVGKLPAAAIEGKAREAAASADAVRLSGTLVSKGSTYRLQMRLTRGGGTGEVSGEGGETFQLLRVEKELFLKADAGFWARQEGGEEPTETDEAAAAKLEGKYVRVPEGDPAYEQLAGFTELDVMLEGLLVLDGKRETGPYGKVDGTRTIEVRAAGGQGGRVQVSLEGTPYPLNLTRPGDAGTVRLADWDEGFTLEAPEKDEVVDYGKEISADG